MNKRLERTNECIMWKLVFWAILLEKIGGVQWKNISNCKRHGCVSSPPAPHLYCKASLSAVALDSYFPTSMLILSALLLHSSRVMVRRSFWDLRCSIRLQSKENYCHLRLEFIRQYFSSMQVRNARYYVGLSCAFTNANDTKSSREQF